MKRILLTLIALAITSMASAFHFSATASTGQTLYFTVIGIDSVKVVAPATHWNGYPAPEGRLVIPAIVSAEGETFRVISIDKMAFQYCRKLTSVVIPASVSMVGQRAFYGDTMLTSVQLAEGVERIGMMAFGSCTRLDTIGLPSTLEQIAMSAFDNTAYFNDSTHWNDEMMLTLGQWVIKVGNRATDTVHVPEGMKGIANNAFLFCRYIEKVVLPSTLAIVGQGAFEDCQELDTLQLFAEEPPMMTENAFSGVTPLPVLVVPCGSATLYGDTTQPLWSAFTDVVEMPCPTAVDEVVPDEPLIVVPMPDGVSVRGVDGLRLTVYDMTGRCVAMVDHAATVQRIPLPKTGIYLLLVSDGRKVKISYCSR